MNAPNPYQTPDCSGEELQHKPLDRSYYFSLLLFPTALFFFVAQLANQNGEKISLPTYPFVNIDRWAQARIQMILIIGCFWFVVLAIHLFIDRTKYQNRIWAILGWNMIVIASALVMAYFKLPDWLP